MFTHGTAPRRGAKTAASIAALLLLPLSLTACGGGDDASSSLNGEYYGEESQLVIDGSSVVIHPFESHDACEVKDRLTAEGSLSDDATQVVWSPDFDDNINVDNHEIEEGVSSLTTTTSGDTKIVTIAGYSFNSTAPSCN